MNKFATKIMSFVLIIVMLMSVMVTPTLAAMNTVYIVPDVTDSTADDVEGCKLTQTNTGFTAVFQAAGYFNEIIVPIYNLNLGSGSKLFSSIDVQLFKYDESFDSIEDIETKINHPDTDSDVELLEYVTYSTKHSGAFDAVEREGKLTADMKSVALSFNAMPAGKYIITFNYHKGIGTSATLTLCGIPSQHQSYVASRAAFAGMPGYKEDGSELYISNAPFMFGVRAQASDSNSFFVESDGMISLSMPVPAGGSSWFNLGDKMTYKISASGVDKADKVEVTASLVYPNYGEIMLPLGASETSWSSSVSGTKLALESNKVMSDGVHAVFKLSGNINSAVSGDVVTFSFDTIYPTISTVSAMPFNYSPVIEFTVKFASDDGKYVLEKKFSQTFSVRGAPTIYLRGDFNEDILYNLEDVQYLLSYMMFGADAFPIYKSADVNGNSVSNIEDVTYLLKNIMLGDSLFPLAAE